MKVQPLGGGKGVGGEEEAGWDGIQKIEKDDWTFRGGINV